MKYNVLLTHGGGCGTTHMMSCLQTHRRPDCIYCHLLEQNIGMDKNSILPKFRAKEFHQRTGGFYLPSQNETIEVLTKSYIEKLRQANKFTVLIGSVSIYCNFFTKNKYNNVLGFIRHPVNWYVSYCHHKHPKLVEDTGGLNSKKSICKLAMHWKTIVDDMIGGNLPIIRYEYAPMDIKNIRRQQNELLCDMFYEWDYRRGNPQLLTKENIDLMYSYVKETYHKLYNSWEFVL